MKLLDTGARGVRWKDIEVVRNRGQAPTIKLHWTSLARAQRIGLDHVAFPLSHSVEYAVSPVVGECEHGNIVPRGVRALWMTTAHREYGCDAGVGAKVE